MDSPRGAEQRAVVDPHEPVDSRRNRHWVVALAGSQETESLLWSRFVPRVASTAGSRRIPGVAFLGYLSGEAKR